MAKKKDSKEIIVSYAYCELLSQPIYINLMKKQFTNKKVLYRITRACDVIHQNLKKYIELKQKIQDEFALKDEKGEIIKKKDSNNQDTFQVTNIKEYFKAIEELNSEEIKTRFDKIEVSLEGDDLPHSLTGEEFNFLMPFITIKEETAKE